MKTKSIFLSKCHKHFKHVFFLCVVQPFFSSFSIVLLYITSVRIRFLGPLGHSYNHFSRAGFFLLFYQPWSYSCWPTRTSNATSARYFTYQMDIDVYVCFFVVRSTCTVADIFSAPSYYSLSNSIM